MVRDAKALRIQEAFLSMLAQEKQLKLYYDSRGAFEQFYQLISSVREAAERGARDILIDNREFQQLVTALEHVLLIIVTDAFRESYRRQAKPLRLGLPPSLKVMESFAQAELKLRKLTIACLKSARGQFRKPDWDPKWNGEIERATVEHQDAALAWHRLKLNAGRNGSVLV